MGGDAPQDPPHGLERRRPDGEHWAARGERALLLRPQLRRRAERRERRRRDHGVRPPLRQRRRARQRVRVPVSPREEPGRRPRAARAVPRVVIVLPAIDLLGGKAVRLHQGRYDAVTVYDEDPPARARAWRGKVPLLHVVDLEGARTGQPAQRDMVRAIVEAFGPGVEVGGGVRTRESFETYVALGAARIVLGSAAIKDEALVRT